MAEENKKSIDELKTSADSLLARLNSQLGAESAKTDGAEERPASSPATGGLTDENTASFMRNISAVNRRRASAAGAITNPFTEGLSTFRRNRAGKRRRCPTLTKA